MNILHEHDEFIWILGPTKLILQKFMKYFEEFLRILEESSWTIFMNFRQVSIAQYCTSKNQHTGISIG